MRFLFGFGFASLLWGVAFGTLYAKGWLQVGDSSGEAEDGGAQVEAAPESVPERTGRRARRRARSKAGAGRAVEDTRSASAGQGELTTGDDLDWDGERRVDMAGGEAQLSGAQIEAGFDSAMPRIRRCLALVPGDGEIAGTLTFGMRVGRDGQPRAVNLTGPSAVTAGESGGCLRQAAEGIRFPPFEGPDMLFRYPITLH